jgi:hypothetical protein
MKPTIENREKSSLPLRRRFQASPAVFLALALFGVGRISPLLAEDSTPPSVSGVVTAADTGKPIANALVRVSSPAIDMRSKHGQQPGLYDGLTDAEGRFTIQVPKSQKISLNAFAPGYEEAAGMWMSGNWTFNDVPFPSSHEPGFNIKLRPAVYLAGIVTDDSGRPFSGADVETTIEGKNSTAYVAFDTTAANGRFEIFDFPLHPVAFEGGTNAHGLLTFRNSTKLTRSIANIYALSAAERTNLHVTLNSGHDIKGIITLADGQPSVNTAVEAVPAGEMAAQRTSLTDVEGRFMLRGLPDGEVSVQAHSPTFDQLARKTVQLAGADAEVNLPMEPVVFKNPPRPVTLLGMKLANVTPELQAVYNLDSSTGVVILDPGTNHLRLEIGALSPGERFWVVGNGEINNLRELVKELLRIDAITPPGDPNEGCHGSIRVAYVYRNFAGTNTQRLKLTDADRAELKSFLLAAAP